MKIEALARRAIQTLDLTKIRARVKKEHPRWSLKKLNAAENEYRGLLFVFWKHPKEGHGPPTKAIDEFWHAHILHTKKYMDDCQRIYGYYLHHFPTSKHPLGMSKA